MTQEAKILFGIGIVTVIILFGGVFFLNNTNPQFSSQGTVDKKILVSGKNTVGSPTAKVTVVEFADFQCPACGAFYPGVKKILSDYKGKIFYVYRNFPLSIHKNAMKAAGAAESAGSQGKFWVMHDKLFENQQNWSEVDDPTSIFEDYAKSLKLNEEKFKKDLSSDAFLSVVQKDMRDGGKAGVNATPSVYINGKKVEGASSIADLSKKVRDAVDTALNTK